MSGLVRDSHRGQESSGGSANVDGEKWNQQRRGYRWRQEPRRLEVHSSDHPPLLRKTGHPSKQEADLIWRQS